MDIEEDPSLSGDYLLAEALNRRGDYFAERWPAMDASTKRALAKVCLSLIGDAPLAKELSPAEKTLGLMRLVLAGAVEIRAREDEDGHFYVGMRVVEPAPPPLSVPLVFSLEDMAMIRDVASESSDT